MLHVVWTVFAVGVLSAPTDRAVSGVEPPTPLSASLPSDSVALQGIPTRGATPTSPSSRLPIDAPRPLNDSQSAPPRADANDDPNAAAGGGDDGGQPVPEPTTLLLVGTGLVGLALSSKRWRRTIGTTA